MLNSSLCCTLAASFFFLPIIPAQAQTPAAAQTTRTLSQAESPDGRDPATRAQQRWRRIAFGTDSTTETARLEDLDIYLRRYQERNIYDPVLAVFNVKATPQGDMKIALSGEVGLRWYMSGVEAMLTSIGFEVVSNNIVLLPEDTLGTSAYAYAIVPSATMRSHPAMDSEQVNAIPYGWPMRLLRESTPEDLAGKPQRRQDEEDEPLVPYSGTWFLAQGSEGYIGYVRADQVHRSDTYRLPEAILLAPQEAKTPSGSISLPGGAALYPFVDGLGVPSSTGDVGIEVRNYLPPRARITSETILSLSKPLMDTPYVWGGVTEAGIDCSGYTQYVYRMLGVYLPRDARPQSVVGRISAFGEDVEKHAAAGDLVYFADEAGRISHIGIALGDGMLIHSSGGVGVHVCDYHEVSRSRPNGMLERTLYARRVLY